MTILNTLFQIIANNHNNPLMFSSELVYAIIISISLIFISIKIFHSNTTIKHTGIHYLTIGLSLFALAYLIRALFLGLRILDLPIPNRTITTISLLLIAYISSLAIVYIIQSNLWRKYSKKRFHLVGHMFALISVIAIVLPRLYAFIIILVLQFILLSIVLYSNKHTKNIVYPFLSIFWLLNMILIFSRNLIPFEIKIALQILALGILGIFYIKVQKWLK